jgi:uncharacterized protein DUF1648/uncharacterized protein DUF5808
MSDVREASLEPGTRPLPGPLAQAGPFALLGACGCWIAARWNDLPARVPIHWNIRGEIDRTVAREPLALALPLLAGAVVCALLFAIQAGIRFGSPRHRAQGASIRLVLAAEYLVAIGSGGFLAPILAHWLLPPLIALLVAGVLGILVMAFVSLRNVPRGGERNPRSWHGPFYADKQDPALFVPKRYGYGYTVNLAHRFAPLLVLAILALPALALLLALSAR